MLTRMGVRVFSCLPILSPKIFLVQNFFWVQENVGLKKICSPKIFWSCTHFSNSSFSLLVAKLSDDSFYEKWVVNASEQP